MARTRRVAGKAASENEVGRFDMEEMEDGEIVEDEVATASKDGHSHGVVITFREPVSFFRTGNQIVKSGGTKQRIYSQESHGDNWRELADEFVTGCVESERRNNLPRDHKDYSQDRRPKFISKEEF